MLSGTWTSSQSPAKENCMKLLKRGGITIMVTGMILAGFAAAWVAGGMARWRRDWATGEP